MQKTNKIDIIIIIMFVIILIMPHILYFFIKDKLSQDTSENRNLATKPALEFTTLQEFPSKYDEYFNDNLPFRRFIQKQYNNMNYYIFKVKSFNNVMIGKKTENGNMQWLFYDKKSDGDPLQYALGMRTFTDDEKRTAIINIKSNLEKLKEKNIDAYYFIAPNKSTIYKELLPDSLEIKSDKNAILDLYEYIKSQGVENIVYPYHELIESKKTAYSYLSLDTHWNIYGGFVGVKLLHHKINPEYDYIFDNAKISKGELVYSSGDLSKILHISGAEKFKEQDIKIENFQDDVEFTEVRDGEKITYENKKPLIDKEIMIIGDSFSVEMSHNLIKMYSKITYIPVYGFTNELLDNVDPDIVIIEAVERYIDSIIDFFIA